MGHRKQVHTHGLRDGLAPLLQRGSADPKMLTVQSEQRICFMQPRPATAFLWLSRGWSCFLCTAAAEPSWEPKRGGDVRILNTRCSLASLPSMGLIFFFVETSFLHFKRYAASLISCSGAGGAECARSATVWASVSAVRHRSGRWS
uniref:Uncharacterized protein n=1 Tax=Eutreptiella gymnastica TaxID=73025 RepID=A0A7S4FVU4_9EUGL